MRRRGVKRVRPRPVSNRRGTWRQTSGSSGDADNKIQLPGVPIARSPNWHSFETDLEIAHVGECKREGLSAVGASFPLGPVGHRGEGGCGLATKEPRGPTTGPMESQGQN